MTAVMEPGVYPMTHAEYLAGPVPGGSLSSSGARMLLPPSCPALFDYYRRNPQPSTGAMELGTAAHGVVLGTGPELAVIKAKDWRTRGGREAADEARAAGKVPLLEHEHEQVQAMAAALRAHPLAGPLLCREDVEPEQTLIWYDPLFGIWRRARLDATRSGGRLLVSDYKTTVCAEPGSFARSVANYGYHGQGAYYLDAAMALLDDDPSFLLVAQEKKPPYLVTVCEPDADMIRAGHSMNRRAMEVYRDCAEAGVWPSYTVDAGTGRTADDEIALISLPPWARDREDW